jgi:hypothetical protein
VSLTVFVDEIFLIIISTAFLFYTFLMINQNQIKVVENQTQAIINSTEVFLISNKNDANLLVENEHVINRLKYIN